MGLAASQARLLTITARKSDCEFQSMSLSHQKIALARDMERISDEYQKALNQTKLVYDYYGSGTSQMNLDYNLLMTPSVYNDYYPKFLTDNKNRIVLDGRLASAARAAGIPPEGYMGTPSSLIRDKFVEAMADSNVISTATAVSIKSIPYNNGIGIGGSGLSATTTVEEVTYDDLLQLIKTNCQDTVDYGLRLGEGGNKDYYVDYGEIDPDYSDLGSIAIYKPNSVATSSSYFSRPSYIQEPIEWDSQLTKINLYDLLDYSEDATQYDICYRSKAGELTPIFEAQNLQDIIVGKGENSTSFLNWMLEQFSKVFGGTSENDMALQYAYDTVYDLLYPTEDVHTLAQKIEEAYRDDDDLAYITKGERTYSGVTATLHQTMDIIGTQLDDSDDNSMGHCKNYYYRSCDYIGTIYSCRDDKVGFFEGGDFFGWGGEDDGDNHSWLSLNLNNLAKVFLTAYKEYLEGLDVSQYSYEKGQSVIGKYNKEAKANLYVPKPDDTFLITGSSSVEDSTDNITSSFYDTIFNMICLSGWVENDKIAKDSEYMQEMLKSGAVFISSINNDNNYYQSNYSTDTYISEIADMEGVAQAEAKYNTEKAKIEAKENRLDVKMKNLDAEISSLTTEYDSVKSVITKAVEKSFKRYDA